MAGAARRTQLPRTGTERDIRNAIMDALSVLGEDMRLALEPTFVAVHGPEWPYVLLERQGKQGRASANDLSLLIPELLAEDSCARDVLGATRPMLSAANRVRRLRNDVVHFEDGVTAGAVDYSSQLRDFARLAGLPCAGEFADLHERLVQLRNGTWVDREAEAEATARVQLERAETDYAHLEEQRAAQQAELERAKRLLAEHDAVKRGQDAEGRALDTKRAELAAAEASVAAQVAELDRARADFDRATRDRERTDAPRRGRTVEAEGSAQEATLDSLLAQLAPEEPAPFPGVGEPWPYVVGQERWALSKAYRRMIREDRVPLADIVGEVRAKRLVDDFLSIRPDGGTVRVDDDGDAVTWKNGGWVYLGRLPDDEDVEDADPFAPGAVLDPDMRVGRRFTMSADGEVRPWGGGPELATVLSKDLAKKVKTRIRAIKPQGGRLWVAPSGLVTAYVGDDVVAVTRLGVGEWFPGVVSGPVAGARRDH